MTEIHGVEKVDVRDIPELKTKADLCRHAKTGYQLLPLVNNDENKVFGINLRTPASDSTRVAHILGHSILLPFKKVLGEKVFIPYRQFHLPVARASPHAVAQVMALSHHVIPAVVFLSQDGYFSIFSISGVVMT